MNNTPAQALIVVDMQNDFITGPLGSPEGRAIVPVIAEKIKTYHGEGKPVIFTQDTHFSDTYLDSTEGRHLPVVHCVITSDGWQIIPELEKLFDEKLDKKIQKSTFGSKHLKLWAEHSNCATFEFCGVCTGICLVTNIAVVKTWCREAEIYVDPKACACVSPETHNAAITVFRTMQVNILD